MGRTGKILKESYLANDSTALGSASLGQDSLQVLNKIFIWQQADGHLAVFAHCVGEFVYSARDVITFRCLLNAALR